MIPILPYHFLNSPAVQHEASPAFVADVIVQFSKQVMRPRVMLPLLAVIILLFDLDDAFDMDDEFFLEDEQDARDEQDN
ncbi:predicted protein [Lichtheimia corymbifera JMRC:FSU:9682]|uniref:Uncharacterized protein n=1 Tax=Lichtheimia corymbifera JMRC:FSU:9682 TaxID=1263082 RepID=A0A068S943_9FUNG|nr:predicted protein [Lichtheimia corymbifera JMRC:FSU:9682]